MKIKHAFVDNIPAYADMEDMMLYVSLKYNTAIHKCICGCGERVVTPLSNRDWVMIYDGFITLWPSIGNWSF